MAIKRIERGQTKSQVTENREIQITHQLDEQPTQNIGTISKCDILDWLAGGMEVQAVDLFAVSVINYSLLASQATEQIEGGGGDKEDVQFVEGSPGEQERERR